MSDISPLTLEGHLSSFQTINPIYEHLYAAWKIVKADFPRILMNVSKIFPHYSLHDESHSEAIVRQIEAVLGDARISMLKPTETWLILMSAYTHDLGMLVQDSILHETWRSEEFKEYLQNIKSGQAKNELKEYADWFIGEKWSSLKNGEVLSDWPLDVKWAAILLSADYFRSVHPKRGRDIITGEEICFQFDLSFNRFVHERLLLLLGEVAFLHGEPFERIFHLSREANGVGQYDDIVYPRRVACLLRLGDLLDMDNGRFDEDAYLLYGEVPGSTISNREKHASITHFLVKENRIEIGADCPTEDGFEVTSKWIAMLQRELENLALHWNDIVPKDFGTAPTLAHKDIRLNGRSLHGDVLRRFNFKDEAIFELLEGANIYKNKFACFRELIQNAVDASKLRLWYEIQAGRYAKQGVNANDNLLTPFKLKKEILEAFPIEVEIKHAKTNEQEDGFKITVKDCGIGINEERLRSMENVARSWSANNTYKKKIKQMPKWLQPTGEFGLGLQSVFQLTDTLECDTTPLNATPKHIVFRSKNNEGRISYQDRDDDIPTMPGSKFTFFIPMKSFKSYKYSIGGTFYKKIKSMDLFDLDPEYDIVQKNIYYLYQAIEDDVDNGLFPIIIRGEVNSESILEKEFPIRFYDTEKEHQQKHLTLWNELNEAIDKGDVLPVYIDDTTRYCYAYNVEECILYQLGLGYNGDYSPRMKFSFKGMHVECDISNHKTMRNFSHFLHGEISLEGYSAKEYLALNREKIKEEKLSDIYNIIQDDLETIARLWFSKISERVKENNPTDEVLLGAIGWSSFLNDAKYKIPDEVVNKLPLKINVLKKNSSNELVNVEELLSNLLMKIRRGEEVYVYIFDSVTLNKANEEDKINTIKAFMGEFISDVEVLYNWGQIKNIVNFDSLCVNQVFYERDEAGTRSGRVVRCCKMTGDAQFCLPQMSPGFEKKVTQSILRIPRVVFLATNEWRVLAVKYTPWVLEKDPHMHFIWCIGHDHCAYIISPFKSEDLTAIIRETQSESIISNTILHRADFKRLIRYVKEYNIDDTVTEEEIQNSYIKWINYIIKRKFEAIE